MKKLIFYFLILFFITEGLFSQESSPVLGAMQKNFARGSISTKIQVLQDSVEYNDVNMGPLYTQALQFILDNSKTLANDLVAQEMTVLAVRLAGINGYSESASMIWKLFDVFDDIQIKVEILSALGNMKPEKSVVSHLNDWLRIQNENMRTGQPVEKQIVAEAVVTLGKLGDSDSFPIVFSTGSAGYSDDITYKANTALKNLGGNYSESLTEVIKNSVPDDKLAALNLAVADDEMPIEEKGELYKTALVTGLTSIGASEPEKALMRELRYNSVRGLTNLKWADASNAVIEHFNQTISEYDRGVSRKSNLLEAIACLGAMGTHEAAVRLTMYLELMNSYMENGQEIDSQIAMAVMVNIGAIGDNVAFDHLLYSGYLDYPATVKRAAREALNSLKN